MNLKKLTQTNNPTLLTSFSIIIAALLISITILGLSGGISKGVRGAKGLLPKFAKYQKLKEIGDYTSPKIVLESQPKLSYNSNSKYLFVEVSDLDCVNCANFHGNGSTEKSTFNKVLDHYVKLGKMDYVWIDNQNLGPIIKHSSLYCAAEQDTKKFFEYKETLYKNYGKTFDINTAKDYIKPLKLDEKKFEECVASNKYDTRVQSLSQFSQTQNQSGTPTFLIYEIAEVKVKVNDKDEIQKQPKLLTAIVGNMAYESLSEQIDSFVK
jgi:protein-disulfide isomerase